MTTAQSNKFQILFNEARIAGLEAGSKQTAFFGCGFAWLNIKPANSGFAKWLVATGNGWKEVQLSGGGVNVFVHDFGQCLVQKEAYAQAFAAVLGNAGINVCPNSRVD